MKHFRHREDLRMRISQNAESTARVASLHLAEPGDRGMTMVRSLPSGGTEAQPPPGLAAGHVLVELPLGSNRGLSTFRQRAAG